MRVRGITPDLADKARTVAHRLADILRAGGDWREADAPLRVASRESRVASSERLVP